ncbi:hypothetical protein FH972_021518 [Carpinus fangiana]|uniref:Uncharacterized protein n=1 Tax=Carpinus fangiana TaxID=176857 RepID=A0A5N6KPX5_9ROSI|nr:hypothetical protein FH972_021518 [Carpinus fangiana]
MPRSQHYAGTKNKEEHGSIVIHDSNSKNPKANPQRNTKTRTPMTPSQVTARADPDKSSKARHFLDSKTNMCVSRSRDQRESEVVGARVKCHHSGVRGLAAAETGKQAAGPGGLLILVAADGFQCLPLLYDPLDPKHPDRRSASDYWQIHEIISSIFLLSGVSDMEEQEVQGLMRPPQPQESTTIIMLLPPCSDGG